jgi:serine phosphatase RsbU (regulator of sigma subunit)
MKEVKYGEKKIKLSRGNLLIFLTDGIIEARDHLKELYGEERLEKLLLNMNTNSMRSHEIKNAIIKDVNEFSGKQQQHDDMTLIVVKLN